MSDKGSSSPAASPDAHDDQQQHDQQQHDHQEHDHQHQQQQDDNDSAGRSPREENASASPKSSPRAAAGDANEDEAEKREGEGDDEGRRATSRSPSPADRKRLPGVQTEADAANPGNNLYVANLPHRLTQTDLEELFAKFGRLEKCEVIADPVTRESRGFGFVTFEDVRDASDAVAELNGKEIQGRRIRVEHAKRQRGHEKTPGKYLGPRLASSKYGRDARGRSRSRSRDRPRRSRSRSRDRGFGRRYDDRERFDRRYDDRGDRGRGGYDRYDDRRSRR